MQLQRVKSTNIAAVGYDAPGRELVIKFHTGATYKYFNVPLAVYQSILKAKSKGRAFHTLVIQAKYPYEKIG
jgi:hypothetical protein